MQVICLIYLYLIFYPIWAHFIFYYDPIQHFSSIYQGTYWLILKIACNLDYTCTIHLFGTIAYPPSTHFADIIDTLVQVGINYSYYSQILLKRSLQDLRKNWYRGRIFELHPVIDLGHFSPSNQSHLSLNFPQIIRLSIKVKMDFPFALPQYSMASLAPLIISIYTKDGISFMSFSKADQTSNPKSINQF